MKVKRESTLHYARVMEPGEKYYGTFLLPILIWNVETVLELQVLVIHKATSWDDMRFV